MKRRLDNLVDRGCWISNDRVYAFVSADHGITEVGYHGMQPVSRNSRVLVGESGVLSISILSETGTHTIQTNDINWEPSRFVSETPFAGGTCSVDVEVTGRRLLIRCRLTSGARQTISIRFAKDAFFANVHGERTWSQPRSEAGSIVTGFHDRIMLQSWLKRSGPYAGDFLIPEPIRRRIFSTSKRSGLSTVEDLREEYLTRDLPIYDAQAILQFGGTGFSLRETPDEWFFEQPLVPGQTVEFAVESSDSPNSAPVDAKQEVLLDASNEVRSRPALMLDGFPHIQEFVESVPALVDSCIVNDFGVPRACPGRYYWIWAWDALVAMSEALRWGDSRHAASTIEFIEHHRDENGHVPARWTRSLEPLDTPSAGGIEFLQLSLAYETYLERGDRTRLTRWLQSFKARFAEVEQDLMEQGLVKGEGFYPDLFSAFGRSGETAVCMEVGSWYAYCRILGNIARELGDRPLADRSDAAAASVMNQFDRLFWEKQAHFYTDAMDTSTGQRNSFHPLFSLMFLQSPLGLELVRPHLQNMSQFVSSELLTDSGLRVLPLNEAGTGGEAILDSWYPHWDLYGLKLFRRTGDAGSIMRWLACTEQALSRLGYCPEFLALKGFRENSLQAWQHHGSASNLNCVTSWFRALRESVVGFEFDPGGITHLPLSLPLPTARVDGIRWRGATWAFESRYAGIYFDRLEVDGAVVESSTKIPIRFCTPGAHHIVAHYGDQAVPCFTEFLNARLVSAVRNSERIEAIIEPLGRVEVVFFSPRLPAAFADDRQVMATWDRETGQGSFSLPFASRYTILIQRA